ncbi:hypothetical protein DV736_g2795, partial [Chaetothyriales sp. CBS 134916]
MPIKPLSFKGDKKSKKRKQRDRDDVASTTTREVTTAANASEDDDIWTTPDTASDLSGPVILVLATTPPTCLASDAHGNVFASAVENMVEAHAETAEPHDVRQVGDGEAGEPATELVIKMQARFKPRVQQSKASKAKEKVSRTELEQAVGRRLEEDES